ncbi:hypothetical protein P0136_11070 [Lentisphaerota bacterium ZTH]|nr:hypothetical protein JYG24_11410 [Lentisphaerota bacterium]WET05901.1 hypothetical protein P0136_11070 [Lentisphaerota bacterium ZTH]
MKYATPVISIKPGTELSISEIEKIKYAITILNESNRAIFKTHTSDFVKNNDAYDIASICWLPRGKYKIKLIDKSNICLINKFQVALFLRFHVAYGEMQSLIFVKKIYAIAWFSLALIICFLTFLIFKALKNTIS